MDLTDPWKDSLLKAGYDPGQPSVWLLEGFLFYLPDETITHVFDDVISLAATGSWMGFDIINHAVLTSPYTRQWIEMQASSGAPWIGAIDDPEEYLTRRGWKATLSQAGQPEANFGRWKLPVIPTRMPDMPHNWYVTAHKE